MQPDGPSAFAAGRHQIVPVPLNVTLATAQDVVPSFLRVSGAGGPQLPLPPLSYRTRRRCAVATAGRVNPPGGEPCSSGRFQRSTNRIHQQKSRSRAVAFRRGLEVINLPGTGQCKATSPGGRIRPVGAVPWSGPAPSARRYRRRSGVVCGWRVDAAASPVIDRLLRGSLVYDEDRR